MKKIYMTLILALVGVSAFSQSQLRAVPNGHVPLNNPHRNVPPPSTQSTMSFYTDYDYMDSVYQVDVNSFGYSRFIWDMNMRYSYAAGDTSLRWAAVDFSPLYDSYNGATAIANSSYSSIMVDTIFFNAGHSNYSGTNDTILVKIIQCTSGGYPNPTGTVLHTDTLIDNTSMTGSTTWLSTATFAIPSAFQINNNTTKFAVRIEYYGSTQDTFGIIAGFGDLGAGQCANIPALTNFSVTSQYGPNSYRHDMRFALPPNNIQQLPTSTGADTYYECDGDNTDTPGTDSQNFIQNWGIWIHATTTTGINETSGNVHVGQNEPNPFNGQTIIPYQLTNNSNVSLTIFDVTGKQVMAQTQNAMSAGVHNFELSSANLAPGVYYYTVATKEGKVTHKMIVTQ